MAHLVLSNPQRRNAITYSMWNSLADELTAMATDDAIRVVTVRGEGDSAFSAGADISEFEQWRSDPDNAAIYNAATHRGMDALALFPKPTIASIRGFCIGGGLEVALVCDIRLCHDTAQFAVTPARLGLGYDLHDTQLLVDRLGAQATREILFTGRRYDAQDALRLGIVNAVCPDSELDALVDSYTQQIADNAPLTIKASKAIIQETMKPPSEQNRDLCDQLINACYTSDDYKEGRAAFAEKRRPQFKGR